MTENTMSHTFDNESGRHPVNVGHLVMGLAFLGLVGVWALIQGDVVQGDDIRWLLPVPWVIAGIAGLLATTLSSRSRRAEHQTGWVGYDTFPADSLPGAEPDTGTGYPYDTTTDWTTDNPYRTTDITDTTEENR
jgi:hypothetical protein